MRLTRLYVDNFQCLVNFELKVSPILLLVGGNGSGKSTVLEVLHRLHRFVSDGSACSSLFGGNTKTRWQSVAKQRFELDVSGSGGMYRYALVVAEDQKKSARVVSETLDFEGQPLFQFEEGEIRLFNDWQNSEPSVRFHANWEHSGLGIVTPRSDNAKLTNFKEWLNALHPVQINPWEISEYAESEDRYPSRDLDNLADWYRHLALENGNQVYEAVKDLKDAIPGLIHLSAKQSGREHREVMASIQAPNGSTVEVALTELSEGQRCLIGLYLLLHALLSTGATLVLDEPDNFIALREIQPWVMKAIDKVEEKDGQLIVASHHPEILNQLAARGAIVLARPDGGATRVLPFPDTGDLSPAEMIASGWENA